MKRSTLIILFLAGCNPPIEGAPCTGDQHCPTGQYCDVQVHTCIEGLSPAGGGDGGGGTASGGGTATGGGGSAMGGGSATGGGAPMGGGAPVGGGSTGGGGGDMTGGGGGGTTGGGGGGATGGGGGAMTGGGGGTTTGGGGGTTTGGGGGTTTGGGGGTTTGGGAGGGGMTLLADGATCTSGPQCMSGVCTTFFVDGDNDGFGTMPAQRCGTTLPTGLASTPGDCCDSDARAKPGQTSYFDMPRMVCGGYDFDCNSTEDLEPAAIMACPPTPPCDCATTTGWAGPTAPPCGGTAPKVLPSQCSASPPATCMAPKCFIGGPPAMNVRQTCR